MHWGCHAYGFFGFIVAEDVTCQAPEVVVGVATVGVGFGDYSGHEGFWVVADFKVIFMKDCLVGLVFNFLIAHEGVNLCY